MNEEEALNQLADKIKDTLLKGFKNLVQDAQDDLHVLAEEIAPAIALAAVKGDDEMVTELNTQFDTIVEINNIRASNEARSFILDIAGVAVSSVSAGLSSLISKVMKL